MKKLIYVCDRCKKPIEKDAIRLYAGIVDPETDEAPECYQLNTLGDSVFCAKCINEIDKIIDSVAVAPKALERKEEPKKKDKKEAAGLDDGKIKALRDAGWTLKAISEKLGCCQQTIANRLKAMEGKG